VLTRDDLIFTDHAVDRMAERGILVQDVIAVLVSGDIIELNLTDRPYPTTLTFAMVGPTPLHVLWAEHPTTGKTLVITTYVPDDRWNPDFRTRRKPS
jgi:Domain of unknown function (DUF4258)